MFSEKALLLSAALIIIASAALDVSLCPAHSMIRRYSVVDNWSSQSCCCVPSHVVQALQPYSAVVTVISSGVSRD